MRFYFCHAVGFTRFARRLFALWNAFAAPELSLEPEQWCYLIAGGLSYRSYVTRAAGEKEMAQQHGDLKMLYDAAETLAQESKEIRAQTLRPFVAAVPATPR